MNLSIPSSAHRAFSTGRILTIAGNTFTEQVRLKVFYILLLFGLLIIGSSFFVGELTVQDQFQVLKDISLGSMSIFTWLLGLLATSMLIPKDLEDRTLYTILAKPVHRHEYLLGKFLGILSILLVSTLAMSLLFVIVLYLREQTVIAKTTLEFSTAGAEVLKDEIARIHKATFHWNLLEGIIVIYVKSVILATLTLLFSTFSSSWIFTVILSVLSYFIGHLQGIAREAWVGENSPLARIFLGLVALIFPDLQLFNLADDIVAGNTIAFALFLKTIGLGGLYFVVYFSLSQLFFSLREL